MQWFAKPRPDDRPSQLCSKLKFLSFELRRTALLLWEKQLKIQGFLPLITHHVTNLIMSGTKIVKRYANRKLYDTERSCYVTLDDISTMIKSGEEVQVIDNKSGDDLTSVTLAQIIFETEKKAHFMPLNLLRGLIQQSGENIGGFAREQVETVQSRAQDIRDTASDTVTRITSQFGETVGRVIKTEGEVAVEGAPEGAAPTEKQSPASVKEMLSSSQKNLEEIQRGIEDRVQEGLGAVSEGFSREVEDILERLGSLKDRFRK